MFKNAFANLQKVGKSLMLPVSVLPIAGILLGVGSANFSWLPAVVSHVMAEAGGSVFANMPLIFAIGVALGFTNNDGVSALAAVVAYGIMVKTMAVVAPLVLHLPADEIAAKHLADTGVLGGIISGAIAAYMFNRFYRIKLPEYLGFFAGKRFVPIISGLAAIFTGVILSFIWPPIGSAIQTFSRLLDNASPEARIVAEAEEESGFRVTRVEPVFTVFMSPGSVTEKLYFFIAEYQADDRRGDGGGLAAEGEDIEVLEWPLTRALQAIRDGEIMDAKTIILLQHLALNADTLLAG